MQCRNHNDCDSINYPVSTLIHLRGKSIWRSLSGILNNVKMARTIFSLQSIRDILQQITQNSMDAMIINVLKRGYAKIPLHQVNINYEFNIILQYIQLLLRNNIIPNFIYHVSVSFYPPCNMLLSINKKKILSIKTNAWPKK